MYKRELTREIRSFGATGSAAHTPTDSRLLGLGHAAQQLGKFHERATQEHWISRSQTEGPAAAAQAARATQSRLGSALGVPALHKKLAPRTTGAKKTERARLVVSGTHIAVPTDPSNPLPQFVVSLRDKGGRSTAYPVMARNASLHPAKGRAPSHKVLTTLEAQRSGGRDAVSALSKGRLLKRGEMTPADAIAVDKHGTFELPGAQATGTKAKADDVIARNTGRTVEAYGRSTSPTGRRLFSAIQSVAAESAGSPDSRKRRYDALREGSKLLSEIEPRVFDGRRTPPGSPDHRAASRHLDSWSPPPSSPTGGTDPSSSSSSLRSLSPFPLPSSSPLPPPASSLSSLLSPVPAKPPASSPAGTGKRKMARTGAASLGSPPTSPRAPTSSSQAFSSSAFPSSSSSSFSAFSAVSPGTRSQPAGPVLSAFAPPRRRRTPASGSTTSQSGLSQSGQGTSPPFPKLF